MYCAANTVREFLPDIAEELLSDDICGKNVMLEGPQIDELTFRFTDILESLKGND